LPASRFDSHTDQVWYAEVEGTWFFDFTAAITKGTDELR